MYPIKTICENLANSLVSRIDSVFKNFPPDSPSRVHAAFYASYITDLLEGRLDMGDRRNIGLLSVITQFCELAEKEIELLA
jgi:hypothetical protein